MHSLNVDNIAITWFGHASFMLKNRKTIYIDPFVLPEKPEKADIILITHDHFDHCNAENVNELSSEKTEILAPQSVIQKLDMGTPIGIGKSLQVDNVKIECVYAYNIGKKFHSRGTAAGFVITIDGVRIYHSGDTDKIPEMSSLGKIDVALLPIGGTYTMTAEEAVEAAKIIKPRYVVPMHYNSDKYGIQGLETDPNVVKKALSNKGIIVDILDPLV